MHYKDVLSKFGNLVLDGTDSPTPHSGATTNNLVKYQPFPWAIDAANLKSSASLGTAVVSDRDEATATSVDLVALPPSSSGMRGFISRCVLVLTSFVLEEQ